MQFSLATIAFLASAVMAHESAPAPESTAFQTVEVTITSCAPTVTNCPARSTVVSSKVIPTSVIVKTNGTLSTPPSKPPHTVVASSAAGVPTAPAPPAVCAPSTVYSTVTVTAGSTPVKSPIAPAHPTGIKTVPGVAAPSGTTGPKNVTAPTTLPFTAGAAGIQSSVAFAAVAGVAAFFLA